MSFSLPHTFASFKWSAVFILHDIPPCSHHSNYQQCLYCMIHHHVRFIQMISSQWAGMVLYNASPCLNHSSNQHCLYCMIYHHVCIIRMIGSARIVQCLTHVWIIQVVSIVHIIWLITTFAAFIWSAVFVCIMYHYVCIIQMISSVFLVECITMFASFNLSAGFILYDLSPCLHHSSDEHCLYYIVYHNVCIIQLISSVYIV